MVDAPNGIIAVSRFALPKICNGEVDTGFGAFRIFPFGDPNFAARDTKPEGSEIIVASVPENIMVVDLPIFRTAAGVVKVVKGKALFANSRLRFVVA